MSLKETLLVEIKDRRDKLLSDIEQLSKSKSTLETDINNLSNNLNILKETEESLKEKINSLSSQRDKLNSEIDGLLIHKNDILKRIEELDEKLSYNISMIDKLEKEASKLTKYDYIAKSDEHSNIYLTQEDISNATVINKKTVLEWVSDGHIPEDIYKSIATDNKPLPKILYVDYRNANDAWAQLHIRGLEPEDTKKYKSGHLSFEELISGHSIHCDLRMKFGNKFVQWVITQDHIKDYFDTIIGRRDSKTGNVSKGLAVVKPSAEEPSKIIKAEENKELIISSKDAKLIKDYVLFNKSYIIEAGDVGATAYKDAYMCAIWLGSAKSGLQREDAHEYFLYPSSSLPKNNKELFNGRFIVRAFKAGKDKRWWFWKAIDNPKPMDPIKHCDTGHYWPIPANNISKFGRESYRDESKKMYVKSLKS